MHHIQMAMIIAMLSYGKACQGVYNIRETLFAAKISVSNVQQQHAVLFTA